MRYVFFLLAFLPQTSISLTAQPVRQLTEVNVTVNDQDWTYKTGEEARFSVSVLQNGTPIKNAKISYSVGPEQMPYVKKDSAILSNGNIEINGGTLKSPGFLRCVVTAKVDGKEYRGLGTAAFEPLSITPTISCPEDFAEFWSASINEARQIPLDIRMTLMPERCTATVNVYEVSFQNFRIGSRIHGILCVPRKEGKYPALLLVPGAGVRSYSGDLVTAEKGIITLQIGIHGIPVTLDKVIYNDIGIGYHGRPASITPSIYTDLAAGALYQYYFFNAESRDKFYYKRVYLGCVRANDFLFTLSQFNGKDLAVAGGSQGGALAIVTAALDSRVKYVAAYYPALSDLSGYLHGRAGGWPHFFQRTHLEENSIQTTLQAIQYYDVVNFARLLKVPGFYSWGFNDETCPPTSLYSFYNVIPAPKILNLQLKSGHWSYPEQREKFSEWIIGNLLRK